MTHVDHRFHGPHEAVPLLIFMSRIRREHLDRGNAISFCVVSFEDHSRVTSRDDRIQPVTGQRLPDEIFQRRDLRLRLGATKRMIAGKRAGFGMAF